LNLKVMGKEQSVGRGVASDVGMGPVAGPCDCDYSSEFAMRTALM